MSSMNHTLSRKRLRYPDYRDSDSDEEFRPLKSRRRHGTRVPLIVTNKVRDLLTWITDLNVSNYFKMSMKNGSKLPHENIIIDDDDEEESSDDIEIQEVKDGCIQKLTPYIESLENPHKSGSSEYRQSPRLLEKNGACSIINIYDMHRSSNGSYDPDSTHRGNGNYNLRQSRMNDLKRPGVISNPDTDIEILLGDKPNTSAPEADEIEILSELPSTKPKSYSTSILQRAAKRCSIKTSTPTAGQSAGSKFAAAKSQPTPYTANEVVRLQEKIQYKLLLEKFISTPPYHRASKKPQADIAVYDDSIATNFHFTKEVLNQPVEDFIQKYYHKPCQLVNSDKAKDTNEKEKPSEIKIDDDDDDDDIQIVDIKLPEQRTRRSLSHTKYLTPEWLANLKIDVSTKAQERIRIDEAYQKELERLKKERLLNRLIVTEPPPPSQVAEPEFPELTPEMEEKVDHALVTGDPEDQLVKITSDFLLRKDFETLSGLNWLNDLVINSYFDLIVMRSKQEGYPSVYAFNTFFYSNYKTKGYQNIRRWTKRFDIFSFDLNFVPIHLGVHWCLAVIDHRSKKISYYDSMGSGEEQCLDYLHDYLRLEHKDKKGQELDSKLYTKETRKDIPQQMNGSDCGMFTLKYAEYISRDTVITFNQSHMQYFRRRMVYELLSRQLL